MRKASIIAEVAPVVIAAIGGAASKFHYSSSDVFHHVFSGRADNVDVEYCLCGEMRFQECASEMMYRVRIKKNEHSQKLNYKGSLDDRCGVVSGDMSKGRICIK